MEIPAVKTGAVSLARRRPLAPTQAGGPPVHPQDGWMEGGKDSRRWEGRELLVPQASAYGDNRKHGL